MTTNEDVRTFRAGTMPEALALVKRNLGPDAVILGTRQTRATGVRGFVGGNVVEITAMRSNGKARPMKRPTAAGRAASTAAPAASAAHAARQQAVAARLREALEASGTKLPEPLPPTSRGLNFVGKTGPQPWDPPSVIRTAGRPVTPPNGAGPNGAGRNGRAERPAERFSAEVRALFDRLREAETPEPLATRLVAEIARDADADVGAPLTLETRLQAAIENVVTFGAPLMPAEDGRPRRVALIGPPGGGKTTTLAKLAAHLRLRERCEVAVVSLDAQRVGTGEQLQRFCGLIGTPLFVAQNPAGVKDALRAARGEVILMDTPGIPASAAEHHDRLAELLGAAQPTETWLVLPATLAASAQARCLEAFAVSGSAAPGLIVTQADDAPGGAVLALGAQADMPLHYLGVGQKVPGDLNLACSEAIVRLLI